MRLAAFAMGRVALRRKAVESGPTVHSSVMLPFYTAFLRGFVAPLWWGRSMAGARDSIAAPYSMIGSCKG